MLLKRVPPGRAGRLWLRRRLRTAEQGRDQLDRKLRILLPELERRRRTADERREQWTAGVAQARTWLLRASLLGGQDALRCARADAPAEVETTWTGSMGLRYPDDVRLVSSPPDPATTGPGNAATAPAAAAVRAALAAGVSSAAAEQAVSRLEAEVAVTRRRLRALDTRWLPSLQAALAGLELSLAQGEQEDGVRLRRAAAAAPVRPAPE